MSHGKSKQKPNEKPNEKPKAKPATAKPKKKDSSSFFLFFGVIVPLLAVAVETRWHICAQSFFDPFPTTSHVLLFLLIPLSNFMAWLAKKRDMSDFYAFTLLSGGMAMGIAVLYSL